MPSRLTCDFLKSEAIAASRSSGDDLRSFETVVDSPVAEYLARGLYYVLPNFGAFDIKTQVVYALPVPWLYVMTTTLYGCVYIAFLLAGAVAIFSRRDFR